MLVCPGVQSALLALFTVLARPGDTICCESITYPGIKGIAAHLGIRLHGLSADDEGIDPDAFAAACATRPPKALYLNPTLLNPTTAIMSRHRREAVAAIAQRYSVPIVEDDAYARLPSNAPPPIATLAPELTFYITGFAKCIGAGLRIAYVAAPNVRYTARVAATLRTTIVMPTTPIVAPTMAEVATPEGFTAKNLTLLQNTAIANFFDLCAISIPLPREGALPAGLMIVARNGDDKRLFRIAALVEKLVGR